MTAPRHPVPRDLGGVQAYRPKPRDPRIDLWLDGNEGPPATSAALAAAAAPFDPELLRRYPDERPLCRALAARHGLPEDGVLLGAGADEVLDRICRAWLAPGRVLRTPAPCFPMVPSYVRLAGGELQMVPWLDGPLPLAALRQDLDGVAVLLLTSPNNPTGLTAGADELLALAQAQPGTLCVFDLAYAEFADQDPTAALLALPNALVVRTFSKGYGLAGLRVGYALGAPELLAPVRATGSPYPCATPCLWLAEHALACGPDAAALAEVRQERSALAAALRALGCAPRESQANFVFATTAHRDHALAIAAHLAAAGIAIRTFPPADPQLAAALRITCPGTAPAFARLLAALASAPRP